MRTQELEMIVALSVDRTYVFALLMVLNDLSGVAVDTGMVRRMVSTVATFG